MNRHWHKHYSEFSDGDLIGEAYKINYRISSALSGKGLEHESLSECLISQARLLKQIGEYLKAGEHMSALNLDPINPDHLQVMERIQDQNNKRITESEENPLMAVIRYRTLE